MKKYVIDIESNGLLDTISEIWMIVCKEIGTDNFVIFSDHNEEVRGLADFRSFLDEVDIIVWHNGIRYDAEAIRIVLGIEIPDRIKQIDTMIMSRVLKFTRFKQGPAYTHSLKAWGQFLGEAKGDYNDWSQYTPEMLEYCKQDCIVNEKIYNHLLGEVRVQAEGKPFIREALRVEHELAKLSTQQIRDGWKFNFVECSKLIRTISADMEEIELAVERHLEDREVLVDTEPKKPQYKKDGTYTANTARMLSEYLETPVQPEDALRSTPPMEPGTEFQRKKMIPAGIGNQESVKAYLDTLGWKPDEWNWKRLPTGQFIKQSPKLTTKSLSAINHPHGLMIDEYFTLRARKAVMSSWMEQLTEDDNERLKGDVNDMGAQSFRQTHKIIANLPSGKAKYGKEIRELFIVPKDKIIISADGAAYQIRLLAHYLKNEEYTKTVLEGDPHQLNADSMGCSRDLAKPTFFAVLYGAGAAKVGNILGVNQKDGKSKRQALIDGIPNLRKLIEKAERVSTNQGYMSGLDGRRVYPESSYKALNYLIQSAEAILMKRTIVTIAEEFKKQNVPFKQLLFYHDEVSYEINPEDTERATKIISDAFQEAPKHYGVDIMEAGDIKVGKNYYEVH